MSKIVCRPRALTPEQAAKVLRRSIEINPANADEQRVLARTPVGRRGGPRRLAVLIGHKWPETGVRLTVQFLDNPSRDLRARILLHMNAWSKTTNVQFVETASVGQVRIARLDAPEELSGYWSYVGTEILGIEEDQPTFNLEGFTMRTPEAEFRRVVRHEAGHTLGFEHEHMRADLIRKIDRRKAIAYFDRTEGWTAQETIEQVLTPLAKKSIMGTTESDPHSVMCYQIPAEITKDGKAIPGGKDITPKDYEFAAKIYPIPKPARDTAPPRHPRCRARAAPCASRLRRDGRCAAQLRGAGSGRRHLPHRRHGPVRARRGGIGGRGPAAEVRARLCDLWRRTGHDPDAAQHRRGRGAHALPRHHRHARTHQGVHQPGQGHASEGQGTDRVRHRSLRDAVPGRCPAAVRRGALAPARPQARLRLHVDGVVDRREAVGVRLRRLAPQLPRHRGHPLRPQCADRDSRRRDTAARRTVAHPRGVGPAGGFRPPFGGAGTGSHPARLRSADRCGPGGGRGAAARHAEQHPRAAVDGTASRSCTSSAMASSTRRRRKARWCSRTRAAASTCSANAPCARSSASAESPSSS